MNKEDSRRDLLNQEKFLEQQPGSYVSIMILNEIQDEIPAEKLNSYFNLLSPAILSLFKYKSIANLMFVTQYIYNSITVTNIRICEYGLEELTCKN